MLERHDSQQELIIILQTVQHALGNMVEKKCTFGSSSGKYTLIKKTKSRRKINPESFRHLVCVYHGYIMGPKSSTQNNKAKKDK